MPFELTRRAVVCGDLTLAVSGVGSRDDQWDSIDGLLSRTASDPKSSCCPLALIVASMHFCNQSEPSDVYSS
jgi:hypothetical protein